MLTRLLFTVTFLCVLPMAVAAQETACTEIDCVEGLVEIASGEGRFAGALGLAAEADADAVAALEQQALREFRWDVLAPIKVSLEFGVTPGAVSDDWPTDMPIGPDAATAMLMVSNDGETFAPLPAETLATEGQVLSIVVFQKSEVTEAGAFFFPSSWTYDLTASPVPPLPGPTVGPVLIPIAFGDDLGCEDLGCGEETDENPALDVSGEPRSEAGQSSGSGSGSGSGSAVADDLARELQTELARVGCYDIAIDGLWGPGSRKAMTAFNAAKGADLSVQSPSAKALVAVAKETGTVCTQ